MRLNLSIKTICSITGADFIDCDGVSQNYRINNIVIDSRSPLISKETLFVIFKGNKTSGEDFIKDFQEKKGVLVLTEHVLDDQNIAQIVVKNCLRALQKIAKYHREKFSIPTIGITGSNGKTTVKEWLYHVLKEDYSIVRSPKSYNSQIGVALSVLEMDDHHELAIFEAGISQPGEMVYLADMIQPTVGVFTGIGDAHNSGFNSVAPEIEKQKEKFILFENVQKRIRIDANQIFVESADGKEGYQYSAEGNNIRLSDGNREYSFIIPFSDNASVMNAAVTYLTAKAFQLGGSNSLENISTLPIISMRLEKIEGENGNILINDAYNLDERSLEIGLQYLNDNKEGKKTALVLAEHPIFTNAENTLLYALKFIQQQIQIDTVIYIGKSEIANIFPFVDQQYDTLQVFMRKPSEFMDTAILFTGSRVVHLETAVNIYTEKKHITRLLVNLESVRHNLNLYKARLTDNIAILAMVKAQSYGSGILETAKFLEKEKVNYFGVAYADEGVQLRKGGIKKPILVMNPEPAAFDDIIDFGLEPSIYSLHLLNAFIHQLILRRKKHFPIHIKLDTGMNRLGFRTGQLNALLEVVKAQPEVYIHSVFSHLSVADDTEEEVYTEAQIKKFENDTSFIEEKLGYHFVRHLANSAGAYHFPNAQFDMVRLGIGLFGLPDSGANEDFENVLRLCSQISQTRVIEVGESVGYGRGFKADKQTIIGIVPVGYADGLRRGLGNKKWSVLIQGELFPIIGNVCMDMCMIDLGKNDFKVGTEVQLFGKQNSVQQMSEILDTIPYEIMSAISTRVQRVYLEE